VRYNLC